MWLLIFMLKVIDIQSAIIIVLVRLVNNLELDAGDHYLVNRRV